MGALNKLFSVGESDSDKNKDKDTIDLDEWSYAHLRKLDNETVNDKENGIIKYQIMIQLISLILIIKLVFVEKNCVVNVFGLETLYLNKTHMQMYNNNCDESHQLCLNQVLDSLLWHIQLASQENVINNLSVVVSDEEQTDDNVMDFVSDNIVFSRVTTSKDKNESDISGSGGISINKIALQKVVNKGTRFFKGIGKATIDAIAKYTDILEQLTGARIYDEKIQTKATLKFFWVWFCCDNKLLDVLLCFCFFVLYECKCS